MRRDGGYAVRVARGKDAYGGREQTRDGCPRKGIRGGTGENGAGRDGARQRCGESIGFGL